MMKDAPYPPGVRVYCTTCGFQSKHWTEQQADVMAYIHRKYVGHANTVGIEIIPHPRWSE